jgi:hypothetical protein
MHHFAVFGLCSYCRDEEHADAHSA